MKIIRNALLAGTALVAGATMAQAEELSVVGSWSSLPLYKQYEAPFWTETLPGAEGSEFEVSACWATAFSMSA